MCSEVKTLRDPQNNLGLIIDSTGNKVFLTVQEAYEHLKDLNLPAPCKFCTLIVHSEPLIPPQDLSTTDDHEDVHIVNSRQTSGEGKTMSNHSFQIYTYSKTIQMHQIMHIHHLNQPVFMELPKMVSYTVFSTV